MPGSVLQYDFDNGNPENDAFDFFFAKPDTGLGTDEVMSAPGDSGGPSQKMGILTGVTSYGMTLSFNNGTTSDVTPDLDSSFGEFGADTRVSKYAAWIDSIVSGGATDGGGDTGTEPKCSAGKQRRGLC